MKADIQFQIDIRELEKRVRKLTPKPGYSFHDRSKYNRKRSKETKERLNGLN